MLWLTFLSTIPGEVQKASSEALIFIYSGELAPGRPGGYCTLTTVDSVVAGLRRVDIAVTLLSNRVLEVNMSNEFLTTVELSELIRIKPQTIRKWRLRGEGPPYLQLTKSTRARALYRTSDINAWLESHSVDPGNSK